MNSKRMLVAVGSAAAVVALVAGCTSDESDDNATTSATTSASVSASGTAEQGGPHNDADVEYVQMMIPHHEQAVEMAELVPSRTGIPTSSRWPTRSRRLRAPRSSRWRVG